VNSLSCPKTEDDKVIINKAIVVINVFILIVI
jgi:hypothetical protein